MRQEARTGEDMGTTKPLTCEEALRQFSAYLDRALAGDPIEAFEAHLETCLDCCDKLEFSRKLDAVVKSRLSEESLPAGIEDKIRRLLRG